MVPSSPLLPADYEVLRTLADSPRGQVVLARWKGREVVCRTTREIGGEHLTELSVLAAIDHPGLARLLDHGELPGGEGQYLTRSWIEGQDLGTWAEQHGEPRELGRLLARLSPGLEHLHRRGFVHGDLKPGNVVVSPDGEVVLTDFGLAREGGAAAAEGVSGTLFAIAPEVLLGQPARPQSDLFALGVLFHQLLLGRRTSAHDFYGRFPAEDYFTATGTRPEELPEWSRDLVAALLDRDPGRRPASAEMLGRALAGRLGIDKLFQEGQVTLRWPVRRGREAWLERWLGSLEKESDQWVRLPDGEDPGAMTDELALAAALGGSPVHRLRLAGELAGADTEAALDLWARRTSEERAGAVLLLPLDPSPWSQRASDALVRTVAQSRAARRGHPAALVAVAAHECQSPAAGWERIELPPVNEEAVSGWLESTLTASPPRLRTLAERLLAASGGSATRLDQALVEASRGGLFLAGDERPRLRPGPLPKSLATEADPAQFEALSDTARAMLAALRVAGGEATLHELVELTRLATGEAARGLDELARAGVCARDGRRWQTGVRLPAAAAISGPGDEERQRELHAARARQLERLGGGERQRLPHLWRAGLRGDDEVLAAVEALLERGSPELALELSLHVARLAEEAGRALDPRLLGAQAFAWAALGQASRAADLTAAIERGPGGERPLTRALVERIRARLAVLDHESARALEHLERAQELDPEDGGEAVLARARLFFDASRDEELTGLVAGLREGGTDSAGPPGPPGIGERTWNNLRAMEAMSLFRLGEVDRAREALEEQLVEALEGADPLREAGLRTNLGTIERRAGGTDQAIEHFERAAELYDRAGLLPGLSRARAMLGGLLRDEGLLDRAEELLLSAQSVRERLGDRLGAVAVRGMLGLTRADRGHARPAIGELEESARQLRESGRSRDALLLAARADEVRARIGEPPAERAARGPGRGDDDPGRLDEGDPRVLLIRARAAWLSGDLAAAARLAERAEQLATSLRLVGLADEIAFVRARLEGLPAGSPEVRGEEHPSDDERLFALLAATSFQRDAALELARRLETRGRDDRAARLLMACAARGGEEGSRELAAHALRLIDDCSVGLSPLEAAALRRHLLGYPDPWPEDLRILERIAGSDEDFEMDVIELLEINHRLVTHDDLSSLLGTIVEQAITVSGAQRGFLVLEEGGELEVDTALDSRRGGIEMPDVEVSGSVLRRALEEMRPMRVSSAVDDPLLAGAPSVVSLDLRSILCVPFEVQKGLRGVIYVDHRLREAAFDERVERLLALLADQAALAIRQVRRVQQIKELNRELEQRVVRQESDLRTARVRLASACLPRPGGGLVGDSDVMRRVHALIDRAADTSLAALICGESGTGKELAARALHDQGPRSEGPFVSENCAAIPATLIEAELFGARRGAFTGADRDREGLFERAHGGTVFLDEIGELPLELQSKLLRVLETGQIRRLGDSDLREVDFRLVAATNRDLAFEVQEGRFRPDLYYRLDGLRIQMPALREHMEDLPALVDHFMRLRAGQGEEPMEISRQVMARLTQRPWPGNVRELFNELARLCVLSEDTIDDPDLVRAPEAGAAPRPSGRAVRPLADLEREAIEHALETTGGDKNEAAELLGISRAKIYQRLKQWREG